MEFQLVLEDKKRFLPLLLLADEQEDMIDRYLSRGELHILSDNGVKCVAVVVALNETECELKNIACKTGEQRKGYGRAMLAYLDRFYCGNYNTMYVGTGEAPSSLGFYQSCGFRLSHRVENFFTDHYHHPIVEDGVLLQDMVYLKKELTAADEMRRSQ